jgi:maleylpyruvate isomerase
VTGSGWDFEQRLSEVESATQRLLDSAGRLDDPAVAAPSLLPGWSRGHVLTHIARNADGLVNLLAWARTGQETPMYASRESREADIEAGAGRTRDQLLADVQDTAARFSAAARSVPPGPAWETTVALLSGRRFPAREALWHRLKEVEIHHVDLDVGYTPAHWQEDFTHRAMDDVVETFSARERAPALALAADDTGRRWTIKAAPQQRVSGAEAALLAWLIGRAPGDGLLVEPGPMPTLPRWA